MGMETTTTVELGNGESAKIGIFKQSGGGFLALTLSSSRTFKTRIGAERWLARMGYQANGKRVAS